MPGRARDGRRTRPTARGGACTPTWRSTCRLRRGSMPDVVERLAAGEGRRLVERDALGPPATRFDPGQIGQHAGASVRSVRRSRRAARRSTPRSRPPGLRRRQPSARRRCGVSVPNLLPSGVLSRRTTRRRCGDPILGDRRRSGVAVPSSTSPGKRRRPRRDSRGRRGADDRDRTGDLHLGKVTLYQLSHIREETQIVPDVRRPDNLGRARADRGPARTDAARTPVDTHRQRPCRRPHHRASCSPVIFGPSLSPLVAPIAVNLGVRHRQHASTAQRQPRTVSIAIDLAVRNSHRGRSTLVVRGVETASASRDRDVVARRRHGSSTDRDRPPPRRRRVRSAISSSATRRTVVVSWSQRRRRTVGEVVETDDRAREPRTRCRPPARPPHGAPGGRRPVATRRALDVGLPDPACAMPASPSPRAAPAAAAPGGFDAAARGPTPRVPTPSTTSTTTDDVHRPRGRGVADVSGCRRKGASARSTLGSDSARLDAEMHLWNADVDEPAEITPNEPDRLIAGGRRTTPRCGR